MVGSLEFKAEFHGPEFNFVHLNTENALPSNRVRDIAQDEEGFMWFATDGGLVRYDGKNTKIFQPANPLNSEDEVFVMKLLPYKNGLLVGTDQGLFCYDPIQEKLSLLSLKDEEGRETYIDGNIISLAQEKDDSFWVSIENEGIVKISSDYKINDRYKFQNIGNYIPRIYVDGNDIVWAVSNYQTGYLFRYDRRGNRFREFPLIVDGKKGNFGGAAIMMDQEGDYWLGTWDKGLIRFNGRNGEGRRYCQEDKIPLMHVHSITQYSPSFLMVGSDSGLMLLDIETGDCNLYLTDELNPESISGQFVYPITKDYEGGIWIGTYYRGINYLAKGSSKFQNWHYSRYSNSPSGNIVSRLCEDEKGNIWIGTADGGLCSYNPETRLFKSYSLIASRDADNINALCCDGNRLWVGMYSSNVGYLDLDNNKWVTIKVEGEQNTSCYAITRDSSGTIWLGATQTFARYNSQKNIFEKIKDLKAWINDIDEDENGELWISTQGAGLFRFDPMTGRWINYRNNGEKGSLPHNHINSVKITDGNEIYISSPKGVYVYQGEQDEFVPLVGFPSELGAYALEKSGDDLWISTNLGLIMVNADGQLRKYTANDGLDANQFLPGSSLLAKNGMIYFGNIRGFAGLDPLTFQIKSEEPRLKFTSLNIINNPIEVGDPHLPVSLNSLKQLELDNSDHTFTIYFSALSFDNPKSNQYKYRLEGFDKTWHETVGDNSATYSNLPPGKYNFQVKAANSEGVWNDEGISLKIIVKPVWYLTTLMKLLYLSVAFLILLLALRYMLWRMERNHTKELERISDNKEKEMFRSKLSFFTIVAHEIRTPVSLIIGPLEKILSSGEKFSAGVKSDLQVIDRNAKRLLSLVNQLLDYKKIEDKPLPIGFRHEKIIPLIESVIERFHTSLQQKNINLTCEFPDPDLEADVDPEAITKLVSNLLNNAMKFTKNSIFVKCSKIQDSDKFEIIVKDNGIGISKENHERVFNPFYQILDNVNETKGGTGLGLAIVKNTVEAHGGEIILESETGHGATFTIILPLKQENVLVIPNSEYILSDKDNTEMSPDDEISIPDDPVLLVVDDNEEMVNFISSHFEKNYEVITASNGKEAYEKMKERTVSLIICDWMMPVMDGKEFLKKIRHDENFSHIPFVMLTAKTDNASKISTMKSGADAYVEKPFSISYLDARIENLLEMRNLLKKKYSQMPLEPLTSIAHTEVDSELLKKLQTLIEENFSNPNLNVDFLAERLGISRSGLYAKIRTLADVTPNELIQITRLKKAAELLKENRYRINEICYMVGFNSSSYFSRCFQKQFGMKPGEFISRT